VPLNVEHLPPLAFWQAVTTILNNVAIAVAACTRCKWTGLLPDTF